MLLRTRLLACLLTFLYINESIAQTVQSPPIPDFAFSQNISAGPLNVSADTRTSDPNNGKIVGTVDLDFDVTAVQSSIGFKAIGTWLQSTKEWSFVIDTTTKTPLDKYGFKNGILVKTAGNWKLSGDLSLSTLKYLSDNKSQTSSVLKEGAKFVWIEGKVQIVLDQSNMSISYGPASLAIKDTLSFDFEQSANQWTPSVITSFTIFGNEYLGKLSYQNGKTQYDALSGSLAKASTLGNLAQLQFSKFSAILGSQATLDATASISTSGTMAELIDRAFTANVSGSPGNITITATKKSEIPSIQMGSNTNLDLWPVSIEQSTTNKQTTYNWNVTSTLGLASHDFSADLTLNKDTIKIKELELIDGFPKLDLMLEKKTINGSAAWDLLLDQKVSASDVGNFLKTLGMAALSGADLIPLNGFVSEKAIEITIQKSPALPSWVPSWMNGSISEFSLTHQIVDKKTVVDFIMKDVPLGNIPGIPQGSKADFSCIAGHGVVAPSMGSSSGSAWFKTAWTDLGSTSGQKFNWLTNSSSGMETGFAMGLADTSVQFNSTTLSGASFSHIKLGGSSQGWDILGSVSYNTGLSATNPISKLLPTTVKLHFSYNGTDLIARENINKPFDDIPSMGISMDTLELSYNATDKWTFAAISKLDLFGVEVPGKVVFPESGDPSFQPSIPAAGVQMNFGGALSPAFKTLTINLGDEYSATGTAIIKKSNGNFISNGLANDLQLNFFLSKTKGWSLSSAQQSGPIVVAKIGQDSFEIDSLGISEDANKEKIIGGKGAFTFGSGTKLAATFMVSTDSTHFIIDQFEPVAGVKMKARASITGVGASKTYRGSVSGDISAADVKTLLQLFDLSPAPTANPLTTSVGGSFSSNGNMDIYFLNIPAINGLSVKPLMTLGAIDTLILKQVSGAKSFHLATHLGIDHLAPLDQNNKAGLITDLTITKAASAGAPNIIDIKLRQEVSFNLGIGKMTFHSYDCHYDGNWTVDGKATLDNLPAFANPAFDLMGMKNSFGLDISYAQNAFQIVGDIYAKIGTKSPGLNFDVIPGMASAALNSIILAHDSTGIEFGMISSLKVEDKSFPGRITMNPTAQSVDFRPEASISVGFTIDFAEAGSMRVGGMVFSVGSAVSVSADTVKVTAGDPNNFFWKDIVKDDHLMGSFSANSNGDIVISMQLPAGGIKESMVLGTQKINIGTANFSITEVTFSTNGGIGGVGEVDINQTDFDVKILPGPAFSITPRGANQLAVPTIYVGKEQLETEFNFRSSSRFVLTTNILGFETLTFDNMDFKANNVQDTSKKFFELSFDTLVLYMDGPGLFFFDLFDGYVNIAGLDGRLKMSLPDPLSPSSTEDFKKALTKLMMGGDLAQDLKMLNAPAFKLIEGHIKVPDFFGGGQIALAPADYEISDLSPMFQILENHMKDDIKIGEAFIQKALTTAINEATSPHEFNVLGATINSNLNYTYAHGLKYTFNFDGATMAGGNAKLTADFSSQLSKEAFSVSADGSLQLKVHSGWHTASSCSFTLTQSELTFKGNIFNDASLSGDLNSSGFSGTASFDDAEFLDGEVSISPEGFSGSIGLQHDHHYLVKLSISQAGVVSVSGHKHINIDVGKTFCPKVEFYFDYDLSYDIPNHNASFGGKVYPGDDGKICLTSFKETSITFSDGHVYGDFTSGSDKYHFHYSFHDTGSSNRYLENMTSKDKYGF